MTHGEDLHNFVWMLCFIPALDKLPTCAPGSQASVQGKEGTHM